MATAKVTVNGNTILDLTDATATADKILAPYTAYGADGSKLVGTASAASGIKYVYSDIDGTAAYNVSEFEKVSVDYSDLADNKFRLWVNISSSNTQFSFEVATAGLVVCHLNWGDGTIENQNSAGSTTPSAPGVSYSKTLSHTYASTGRYCIEVYSDNNLIGGINCQNNAFLRGVEIASYLTTLNYTNKYSGSAVEKITFPASYNDANGILSDFYHDCAALKTVVFRSNNLAVANFRNCASLIEVALPQNAQIIENSLFEGCTSLRAVYNFSSLSITQVPQYCFKNCTSLLTVDLPTGVQTFGNGAFQGASLQTITFPSSVTALSRYMCQDCIYLKEVHMLSTTPPTMPVGADMSAACFKNTHPDLKIYVPSGSLSAYQTATNWASYSDILVGE